MRQNGGALVLCSLRDDVRQMLAWTKLDRFFEIEAETEEATEDAETEESLV